MQNIDLYTLFVFKKLWDEVIIKCQTRLVKNKKGKTEVCSVKSRINEKSVCLFISHFINYSQVKRRKRKTEALKEIVIGRILRLFSLASQSLLVKLIFLYKQTLVSEVLAQQKEGKQT